jgi:hypothetical protein
MSHSDESLSIAPIIALLDVAPLITVASVILLNATACTKRIPVDEGTSSWEIESTVYLTLNSGDQYQVRRPRVEGDSLVGMVSPDISLPSEREIRIALSDIRSIEVERPDKNRTWITLIVVALASIAVYFSIIAPARAAGGLR